VFVSIKEGATLKPSLSRAKLGPRSTACALGKGETVFAQGDPAECVFYIRTGRVKVTFLSTDGRRATIAILGAGDFFGEDSLTVRSRRTMTATAITDCTLERVEKAVVIRALFGGRGFSDLFISWLLARKTHTEEDLLDQLLNSTEKRLARRLLLIAEAGKPGSLGATRMKISQETIAEMIGTTQSRVSFFMNRFRSLGLIDYNGALRVRGSLAKLLASD
jgi:CRP-like cAMP-binding protein